MKELRMVDLATQYGHIKEEVDSAIAGVIENTAFINGPEVKAFKEELAAYLGAKHVIPCANGTDALQIAMMALDLKPGDEVITATFTYVATAEVIALLGLVPVLVDVEEDTFLIDPKKIRAAITPKTKAIVPVHLFGQCANMDEIINIAHEHDLYVIEDNAQAIGADYTFKNGIQSKSGTMGHVGCTSFFPSKNLGCFGDGGALFTQNNDLAEKIQMIANHGQSVQYYHDEVGVNSRLDSIQAAVLRIKLRKLDEYNEARRKAADYYDQGFASVPQIKTPVRVSKSTHVFHQYTLILDASVDRDALRAYLTEHKIPAMIYYPVALHEQKAYKNDRYSTGDFPVTERLVKSVISLPMHTELDTEQQDFIMAHVKNFLENK